MYTITRRIGRLIEIRIWSPVSMEEAGRWGIDHQAVIDAVEGPYVCLVDLVDATVFPPDVVQAYVSTMKGEERLLRTGTLLNPSPTFSLQIQRMIKEANHPGRRAFRDPEELVAWLGEILTAEEVERLRVVVGEHRARSSSAPPMSAPRSRPAAGPIEEERSPATSRRSRGKGG